MNGRAIVKLAACGLVAACASVFAVAQPALAHAELLSSSPAAGAVLTDAPTSITLVFSEPIEINLGAIRLFDGEGAPVSIGTATHPDGHTERVRVSLPSLTNGSYVVDWRVVSADSHPVHAAYTFQIGASSTLTEGLLDGIIKQNHSSTPAAVGLGVSRGLVALALALVFGALTLVSFEIVPLSRRLRLSIVTASVVGAVAGALALPLEVAYATGRSLSVLTDVSAWSDVLQTRIGVAWAIRAALIPLLGVGLTLTHVHSRRAVWRVALGGGLLGVAVAASFGGHGATGRWHVVGIVATVAHVGGMAVWLGGLIALLISLPHIDDGSVRRFSKLALASIGVVVASGAVQALRQVGSFDALTGTSYGTLLIKKLVAVAVLVVIAAVSRHATLGKILGRSEGEPPAIDRSRLFRALILEGALALTIVALTSLLMAANPALSNGPRPYSATLIADNYLVALVVSPGGVGSNDIHLYITSPISSTEVPDSVSVQISDPSRQVDPINVAVSQAGVGHYTTSAAVFPYPAQWKLHISAIYHSFDKVQWDTLVPIR